MQRRQDLNIDARSTSGSILSMSWQALGTHSDNAEPLIAFTTRADMEVRLCRVMESGRSSKIEYSMKMNQWMKPGVVKFVSERELVVSSGAFSTNRVLLYDVDSEKTSFFANLGGRQISQVKYIEKTDSLFSIAFDGVNISSFDKRSKEVISEYRINSTCVGIAWSTDGSSLLAGDDLANLYRFDARMQKCVERIQLDTTSAMSSFAFDGQCRVACGSPFGTVDVLNAESWAPSTSFDKLITGVDSLAFHPIHKSILVAGSRDKRNALRVYECSTGHTMPGWPSETEPIGRALTTTFSDCGRFFAVGCKSGRVQLYAV
jgi:WD40 repeat protein